MTNLLHPYPNGTPSDPVRRTTPGSDSPWRRRHYPMTTQPTREDTMSENRFAHCDNREFVLSQFVLFTNRARTISETCDLRADALARIAELTPRTVDIAARERALDYFIARIKTYSAEVGPSCPPSVWAGLTVDGIIDALGLSTESLYLCGDCGCYVGDRDAHDNWHAMFNRGGGER